MAYGRFQVKSVRKAQQQPQIGSQENSNIHDHVAGGPDHRPLSDRIVTLGEIGDHPVDPVLDLDPQLRVKPANPG